GILHRLDPSYGVSFLEMTSSVYPGFHSAGTAGSLAIGTAEGLMDGGNLRAHAVIAIQRLRESPRRGLKGSAPGRAAADLGLPPPLLFATAKLISPLLTYQSPS
ncbi:MAG TPA: hypothetical protein VM709_05155, partial [Candidatus Sulfotelmatobacter sp.]|nr:hypothetical protein [Candidatus Sulfotelmatobacter sp.]